MLQEPLFQPDILSTIIRNFTFYFSRSQWYLYALGLVAVLSLCICFLKYIKASREAYLFSAPSYKFNSASYKEIASLFFCLMCFAVYCLNIFLLDNSLFNNTDLMSINTTGMFQKGVTVSFSVARLNPVASYDLNIIYAITHNFNLVNCYIILKQIIILLLLNSFLNFIPFTKRTLLLSAIILLPSLFWLNNIIFAEQDLLIFMLAGFIFLRHFTHSGKFIYLWLFSISSLLAVYTKENAVIFYGGLLIFATLHHIYTGRINYSNLFRPIRLAREFPVETILFFLCCSFAGFYLFLTFGIKDNFYVTAHRTDNFSLFRLYAYEIILTIIAWIITLIKLVRKEKFANILFNEGLLFAGTLVLLFTIYILQMYPLTPHAAHKSYYLLLSGIFSIIYIIRNLHNAYTLTAILLASISASTYIDYQFHLKENGRYYRQMAEFFGEETNHRQPLTIAFATHSENNPWIYETWSTALKYYFPDRDITIKFTYPNNTKIPPTSLKIYDLMFKAAQSTRISSKNYTSGDLYIVKKTSEGYSSDIDIVKKFNPILVFENKIFEVYELQ